MTICRKERIGVYASCAVKVLRPFLICLFLLLCCSQHSQAKAKKEVTIKPRALPAESPDVIENIKSALAANPWTVYVIYKNMIKGKIASSVEIDILTFTQDSLLSQNLAAQGYSKGGSSYKVKADAQGAYIWESIQLHENQADIVFLKGELKGGQMSGVIIYQPQGKPVETVNFTTVRPE